MMVGAVRCPTRPPMPTEVGTPSVKARARSWQVAQATVPVGRQPAVEEDPMPERDLRRGLLIVARSDTLGQMAGMSHADACSGRRVAENDPGEARLMRI